MKPWVREMMTQIKNQIEGPKTNLQGGHNFFTDSDKDFAG
jgi:hypothetical protein